MGVLIGLVAMTLSLISLNTGGCSTPTKNAAINAYFENFFPFSDIVLLQETYNLTETSSCWSLWPHTPFSSPSNSRGSGVTTLINNKNLKILSSCNILEGHVLYTKINSNETIFHIYNILVPQSDPLAFEVFNSFSKHLSTCNSDGVVVVGGDFNCTENPALDRLHVTTERRSRVAAALMETVGALSLCDVWRRLNPQKQQFTWLRNNPSQECGVSKARLDRLYLHPDMLSSIHSCKITPCSLSDHSAISLKIQLPSANFRGSAYWHFNNSLLQDEAYKQIITCFWGEWRQKQSDFPNLNSWWDFGKSHIKSITQTFSKKIAHEKREALFKINRTIDDLQSAPEITPETRQVLLEQKEKLNSILKNRAQGALIRSRFKHVSEVDTSSSYFFNLEKSKSISKTISRIRLDSGEITQNNSLIKTHVSNFYKNLYSKNSTDEGARENILRDLPRLDPLEAEDLECPLSLEELETAVGQLGKDKTPGLDGLSGEFYQTFWHILKNDLLSVLNYSFLTGGLPRSFRRAVITLLPKKGDLADIANWRPISLLNNDYKILARLLANRLKECISSVVGEDQTYCVPGRSIHDNVGLIRDIIEYANENGVPLAVVNLDQQKAFDKVDRDYLFDTMRAMGFGDRFLDYIKILYSGSESLVKICGSLTAPFSVEKGIRQGCPLSGLLYSIAIEPFLNRLRHEVGENGFRIPGAEVSCSVSAYADDVSIFVTSERGFDAIRDTYDLFGRASAARLNTRKTQGLWAGSWIGRSDRPLNFSWNDDGMSFLGVHLGNTKTYNDKNWSVCKNRLLETLASWSGISTSLSFKGRVLIANQLAASKNFHCLAALAPPDVFLSELQRRLVDFVWSNKRHYLKEQIVYQKPDKGGFGLVNLQARVFTFRLSHIFRYLKGEFHHSFNFLEYHLRRFQKLNYDFHLFFLNTDPLFDIGMPSYYGEIMRAWRLSGARLEIIHDSVSHVLNLPINTPLIENATDDGASLSMRLSTRGVGLVRNLLNFTTGFWKQPNDVISSTSTSRLPSIRILQKQFSSIHTTLISLFPSIFNERGSVLPFSALQNLPLKPDRPLNVIINNMDNAISAPSKSLYNVINTNVNQLPSKETSYWHKNGILDTNTNIQWNNIYRPPTSKKEGDLQFKLLHNIIPSLQVLQHLNPAISSTCGWCGDEGTVCHLFITCPSIQPLLNCLHSLLHRLLPEILLNFDLYWALIPCARGRNREAVRLSNYLIVSCKYVIYNLYRTTTFVDPLLIFTHRIKNKIIFEHNYFKLVNNDDEFLKKWNINNTLFIIINDKLTWLI